MKITLYGVFFGSGGMAGLGNEQFQQDEITYDLVFLFLKTVKDLKDEFALQKWIKVKVVSINGHLKNMALDLGISKKLTMHISGHSFAQVSVEKIPIQILQKIYCHSNITTTIGYQSNFSTKDMGEALKSVL